MACLRWRCCSLTKLTIISVLIFVVSSIFCLSSLNFKQNTKSSSHRDLSANDRNLKSKVEESRQQSKVEEKQEFVEVLRKEPRLSYSASASLDKYLAEERAKHNNRDNHEKLNKPDDDKPLTAAGADLISANSNNKGNVLSLKSALKDPAFVIKVHTLEDRRQDLYLQILRKRGQIVVAPDGSQTIVSYPKTPVKLPNNLKKHILDWSEREKIWLNITHFPWPEDRVCKHYSVQFDKTRRIPIIGLASYPSSGNTWLRYLIEGITGYYTGSMYNDVTIRKKGFYGEGVPADAGLVLTIKTHGHTTGKGANVARKLQLSYNHHDEVNHTAILLIRNPYKAIIGHRNLDSAGHTGFAKQDQFRGAGWQEFIEIKSQAWLNYYTDWLENNPRQNILVLHYENLQLNLKHSLRKIAAFLGFEEDQGRMACAINHSTGNFKRNHKNDASRNPYSRQQIQLIADSINKLNKVLMKHQKETLPLDQYEFYQH